ncbi:N-acetylmuramoyl-L-alanine amidase [Dendrosporobacter sp. 1207_IL3150]|uniref:N-acetylmuramoyl-L-alanine amidase n=1 Tax=Dendrosporobacter sp. 1207_IL3150 TaxID=3084054 RepID=UPI002FDB0C8F
MIPQIALAGLPELIPDGKPAVSIPINVDSNGQFQSSLGNRLEMTKFNYAIHTDQTTKAQMLRLVIDVSGPVQASSIIGNTNTLIVNVKGASVGSLQEEFKLDGNIADSANIKRLDDSNSQLIVNLPSMIAESDYRVFTLPSNEEAKRPFRVVIDINKPTALTKPPVNIEAKPAADLSAKKNEITKVNYALSNDALTGSQKLRLVFDISGQVQATASMSATPDPCLTVNFKGASLGDFKDAMTLDGKIANEVKFSAINAESSKIMINLPAMLEDSEYKVFTLPSDPKANRPFRVVVDINKPIPPIEFNFKPGLKGKVIVLDPGHGGSDPGAIGLNKLKEKEVTLPVAIKVKALLEKAGAKVIMTRQDDRDVFGAAATAVEELSARTKVANSIKADLFLSIHANAFANRSVGGTSTHYYQKSRYDKMLAQNIQTSLIEAGGLADRGIQTANFYVVKRTLMPAALLELAFISNPEEEKLLGSPTFQQEIAEGIVDGINNFFRQAASRGGAK